MEIYSIGDYLFLAKVFTAISMFAYGDFAHGSINISQFAGLGLLIGLLIFGVKAAMTGKVQIEWLFISWMLYGVLFIPKTNVIVIDVYTGATEEVSNIPIGAAFGYGLISSTGYWVTDKYETAFGDPLRMTGGSGYLNALNMLYGMRNISLGTANSNGGSGDIERTLMSYIRDCVIYDITMELPDQDVTWELIRNSKDLWQTLNVNSTSWDTVTYLPSDPIAGTTDNCANAYSRISTVISPSGSGYFFNAWNNYLSNKLGVSDAQASIQSSLDSLLGTGENAQKHMLNAYLSNLTRQADMANAAEMGDAAAVALRTQAMEQRRIQWASEQSMWLEMARPLMTFIEGFIIALVPLMSFIIMLGQSGYGILINYLKALVWIQLWMPVMAVCNMYLNNAAQKHMQELSNGGLEISSMNGLDHYYTEAASWIATGGMLSAATPILTLFITTGSIHGLLALSERMRGAEFVSPKTAAPDLLNTSALVSKNNLLQGQSIAQQDTIHGTSLTGAEVPFLNISGLARAASRVSSQAAQEATHAFESSADNAIRHSDIVTKTGSYTRSHALRMTNQDSNLHNWVKSRLDSNGILNDLSTTQANEVVSNVTLGLAGKLGGKGLDMSLGTSSSSSDTKSTRVSDATNQGLSKSFGDNKNWQAQFIDAAISDISDGKQNIFTNTMDTTTIDSLRESASEVDRLSKSSEQSVGFERSAGMSENRRIDAVSNRVIESGFSNKAIDLARNNGNEISNSYFERVNNQGWANGAMLGNPTQRSVAAAIESIFKSYEQNPVKYQAPMNEMMGILQKSGMYSDFKVPDSTSISSPEGFSAIKNKVQAGHIESDRIKSTVNTGISNAERQSGSGNHFMDYLDSESNMQTYWNNEAMSLAKEHADKVGDFWRIADNNTGTLTAFKESIATGFKRFTSMSGKRKETFSNFFNEIDQAYERTGSVNGAIQDIQQNYGGLGSMLEQKFSNVNTSLVDKYTNEGMENYNLPPETANYYGSVKAGNKDPNLQAKARQELLGAGVSAPNTTHILKNIWSQDSMKLQTIPAMLPQHWK